MASAEQIKANRNNAKRSTGPARTDRTRFNGLKHGLRAEQVVLPGESQDEFEAELKAWLDDWRPQSHTRAVLVERAAVASWRLRRAVRSEAAFYARLADDAGRGFDAEVAARVERAIDRFEDEPRAALTLLESHAAGLDRLLVSWGGLVEALAGGPGGWDRPLYHQRLMILLGHRADAVAMEAGPVPFASARLQRAHVPGLGGRPVPLSAAEAGAAFEAVRAKVESEVARLRDLREHVADPSEGRRQAMEAASTDTSKEAQLRHRYEMEHEKSLRWVLHQLVALEKSGADLPEPSKDEPEAIPEAVAEPVAAPAKADASEKSDSNHYVSSICGELASVGESAPSGERPRGSSGSPGRPGRPIGADPGPGKAPTRS